LVAENLRGHIVRGTAFLVEIDLGVFRSMY
jgi:hypothetical protein